MDTIDPTLSQANYLSQGHFERQNTGKPSHASQAALSTNYQTTSVAIRKSNAVHKRKLASTAGNRKSKQRKSALVSTAVLNHTDSYEVKGDEKYK